MKTIRIPIIFIAVLAIIASALQVHAFCGFYVAKADTKLFNNKSEVILVRDGNRTVITMSNDFKGDVKDFAMVVPVPVVLEEKNIRVVDRAIFDKLDAYSGPRLVEYFDSNPCMPVYETEDSFQFFGSREMSVAKSVLEGDKKEKDYGVTIEAEYTIGEYDILLLSAKESSGLKSWLTDNGYKIPAQAEEVLEPYIKSQMKFFVVKVNLDDQQGKFDYLNPIQIEFESDRFMLPIRLGMANANGAQDMIVYAFTKEGRVECTNYRTVKIPTDRNIPLFVQPKFGDFYKDLYDRAYLNEAGTAVFLEYAWNVSPNAGVKCDPCVSPAPIFQDFAEAGVNWAKDMSAASQVFFTRMHVRYTRNKFPQDLQFQVTPNKENFQARYILTHPASGDFSCDAGQDYLADLGMRRKREVDELTALTGWNSPFGINYIDEYSNRLKEEKSPVVLPIFPHGGMPWWMFAFFVTTLIIGVLWFSRLRGKLTIG